MIGLYNTKCDLRKKLEKDFDVAGLDKLEPDQGFPKIEGLFIDWKTNSNELEFAHQAVVIENYLKKGIPTIIFDRYLAINFKEYSWLKKFNITFFEPAINNRAGFEFLPYWTKPFEDKDFPTKDRKFDIVYEGNLDDRILSFEKYILEYVKLYPQRKVSVLTNPQRLQHKINEWSNYNIDINKELNYIESNFTILLGSKKEYQMGYLREDLFDIMDNHCIPILPIEHRFYGSAFKNFIVDEIRDLWYIIELYPKYRKLMIEELKTKLLKMYPEFNINTTIEKIKEIFT